MKSKDTSRKRTVVESHRAVAMSKARQRSRPRDHVRLILEATTEFYGTWHPSAGPIHFEHAWRPVLGYSDADTPPDPVLLQSLMHPDDRAGFEAQVDKYAAGEIPKIDCEFRLRTKAGPYRWFQMRGRAIHRGRRGAALEIVYAVFDIQVGKEQRDEILASREQLMAIFSASRDFISVFDPLQFRLITFNRAFDDLIFRAYALRVAPGMCVEDIARQEVDWWNAFFRQTLAEGRLERNYQLPELKETHHVFAQTIRRDGQVTGICVFGHDITSRKRMEEALRRSEEKFATAFREAPFPLNLTTLQGSRYLEVNDAFVEESGYSREELIGRTPYDIHLWVHPEKRVEAIEQLRYAGEVRNLAVTFRTKSGEIREVIESISQIELEGGPCALAMYVDVTERRRAAEALRESEERLRIAIEAGNMYAFQWDVATDLVERSKQSLEILDLPNSDSKHTKQELIDRILPEDRPGYIRVLKALTPEKPGYTTVFRLRHRDGHSIWLEESGKATFGPNGELRKVIGITSNVTQIHQSENALRELSGRLITSQEEERRRIARELHDDIGQEAALICVQAQRLDSGMAEKEHTTRSDVHELYRRIKVLAGDIGKLSHRLHSSELSFLGLTVAAERLCRDFAHQYGINVDFEPKSLPSHLDSARSLCLYRVLQESLQNVVKHSHASQVLVELQSVGEEIVLRVNDNGTGFDVANTGPGLGLLSMRERLNFLGGRFAITSSPGSGTTVTANLSA